MDDLKIFEEQNGSLQEKLQCLAKECREGKSVTVQN